MKGLYGKAPSLGPATYPFVYHLIMTEKVPLLYTFYPSRLMVLLSRFNCCTPNFFKYDLITKLERYLDFHTAIKCIC